MKLRSGRIKSTEIYVPKKLKVSTSIARHKKKIVAKRKVSAGKRARIQREERMSESESDCEHRLNIDTPASTSNGNVCSRNNNNNTPDGPRALSPASLALQQPLPDTDDDENGVREQQQQQAADSNDGTPANRTRTHRKMTEIVNRPDILKTEGNLAENWKHFRRDLEIYMTATESDTKTDKIRIAIFLNLIGRDALKVFDTFNLTQEQKESYADVIAAFENFCKPKKNVVFERFMFISRAQKEGESFDAFLMEIKRLANTCEYAAMENEMLRDRIVHGVASKKVQTKLLEMSDLTYEKAVEKCRTDEVTKEQTESMNKTTATVSEVKRNDARGSKDTQAQNNSRGNNNKGNNKHKQNGTRPRNYSNTNNSDKNFVNKNNRSQPSQNNNNMINCSRCNLRHPHRQCPAYGKNCNACSGRNHYAVACRTRNVNAINGSDFDTNNSDFYVNSITQAFPQTAQNDQNVHSVNKLKRKPIWREDLTMNGKKVATKVDTGSDVGVLPKRILDAIAPNIQLQPSSTMLRAFGGGLVKPIGKCQLKCVREDKGKMITRMLEFEVVDIETVPLLGFIGAVRLRMIDIRRIKDSETRNALKHFL